jgi:hypothetical protein
MWWEVRIGSFLFKAEMKTKKEFRAAVRSYREKIKYVAIFFIVGPVLALIPFWLEVSKFSPIWILWAVLFMGTIGLLQVWYYRKVARDCGLICPGCARVVFGHSMNLVSDTHNCPSCGKAFFS